MIRDPYLRAAAVALVLACGAIFGDWLAHAAMSVGP